MELKRWIYSENTYKKDDMSFLDRLLEVKNIDKKDRADFISPVFTKDECAIFYKDCEKAAKLVKSWMSDNKKIVVFGDYDVDGVCATAILTKTFKYLGYENSGYHIPSRFDEGYGINPRSIEVLMSQEPEAIISVDCGINANEAVDDLKSRGLDVLITDHHTLPELLPNADFILDPKTCSEDENYYDLCGAGVAFYLALHLLPDDFDYSELIQLATMATIADLVPLTRDNRKIVSSGINEIKTNTYLPLLELLNEAHLDLNDVSSGNLAFKIAPSINAAGRLNHAYDALELLISEDESEIKSRAKFLYSLNVERKSRQERVIEDAIEMIDADKTHYESGIILVYSEDWHEGVIGIAASRLVEIYHRPAIVFSLNDGVLKGSARSISDFSIYKAISSASDSLLTFGGHNAACGLSLELSKFDDFKSSIKEYCDENLKEELLEVNQRVDLELGVEDISFDSLKILDEFEPFGISNPKPVFYSKNLNVDSSVLIGKKRDSLKMTFSIEDNIFDGIMFRLKNPRKLNSNFRLDVAYNLGENKYNNSNKIQLLIKNIRTYDPNVKGLPAFAFSYYSMNLLDRIKENNGNINFSFSNKLEKVDDYDVILAIRNGKKIVLNNYESLLSLMYLIYDDGLTLRELLNREYLDDTIAIIPLENIENSCLYGKKSFYQSDSQKQNEKYRELVKYQSTYHRDYFVKMYSHIKKVKKIEGLKFVYSSLYPLSTAIGIEFFKEAGFIKQAGDIYIFNDFSDGTYKYEESKINSLLSNFYLNL